MEGDVSLLVRLTRYDDPHSFGSRLRKRRIHHVVRLIEQCHAAFGRCRIADIGGEPHYWRLFERTFLEQCGVTVTLINVDPARSAAGDDPLFRTESADACDLSHITDRQYDLAHSNSVIEHVGDWRRMEAFASELRRVAYSYYVQTPYFWFPIEPHFGFPFFHWLPESQRIWVMMHVALRNDLKECSVGDAVNRIQRARLLDLKQFRFLFPDAVIVKERIAGLTKSLIAIRGRVS